METKNIALLVTGACILILIGGYLMFSGDENGGNDGVEPPPDGGNATPPVVNETPALNETVNVLVNETEPVNATPVVNVSVNETLNETINQTVNETVNITIPVSNYTTEEEIELLYEMVAVKPEQKGHAQVISGVAEHADLKLKYLQTNDTKYLEKLADSDDPDIWDETPWVRDLLKEGINESTTMQGVYITFKHVPPKPEELEVLKGLGVKMGFEFCAEDTSGFCGAYIPLDKVYEVAMLDFVKQIDSAESISFIALDESIPESTT